MKYSEILLLVSRILAIASVAEAFCFHSARSCKYFEPCSILSASNKFEKRTVNLFRICDDGLRRTNSASVFHAEQYLPTWRSYPTSQSHFSRILSKLGKFLNQKRKDLLLFQQSARRSFVQLVSCFLFFVALTFFSGRSVASQWYPGQSIPDPHREVYSLLPLNQFEMRDTLKGYRQDPTVNRKSHHVEGDKSVLKIRDLFNQNFSPTFGEEIMFEEKYWVLKTMPSKNMDSSKAYLKSSVAIAGIVCVFISIIFVMRKLLFLAEDEEQQLYGEKLEVDATEVEQQELEDEENTEDKVEEDEVEEDPDSADVDDEVIKPSEKVQDDDADDLL